MSAALAVPQHSIPYGSAELKQAYGRNLAIGLSASVGIHVLIVWMFVGLDVRFEDVRDRGPIVKLPDRGVEITNQPRLPGVYDPPVTHVNTKVNIDAGTPVASSVVDPERTIASQEELREFVTPREDVEGTGTGTSTWTEKEVEEEHPREIWEGVEKEPMLVKMVEPVYPPLALKAGIEGKVTVRIWVDKNGRPKELFVYSSTHQLFEEAALDAARQLVFTPAYMNSGTVSVWVLVPYKFKIKRM